MTADRPTLPAEVEAAIEKALPCHCVAPERLGHLAQCLETLRPAVRAACHLAIALFTTGAERAAHRAAAEELEK
jgi:hypothetical protein